MTEQRPKNILPDDENTERIKRSICERLTLKDIENIPEIQELLQKSETETKPVPKVINEFTPIEESFSDIQTDIKGLSEDQRSNKYLIIEDKCRKNLKILDKMADSADGQTEEKRLIRRGYVKTVKQYSAELCKLALDDFKILFDRVQGQRTEENSELFKSAQNLINSKQSPTVRQIYDLSYKLERLSK